MLCEYSKVRDGNAKSEIRIIARSKQVRLSKSHLHAGKSISVHKHAIIKRQRSVYTQYDQ